MAYMVPIEALMSHVDNKYRLVMTAAKRARQLNAGSLPLINPKSRKPTYIVLEELAAGKITYEAEALEGVVEKEIIPAKATPTWFRALSTEEASAEGQAIEEEEELLGEAEEEMADEELGDEVEETIGSEEFSSEAELEELPELEISEEIEKE